MQLDPDRGVICSNCQHVLTRQVPVPTTPVPTLIRTNQTPSPSDASLIRESLSKIDLRQLDDDIDHIQSVLDELLRNRKQLSEYRRNHEPLLSSIRHFPPEILSHIFMLSLPLSPNYDWQLDFADVPAARTAVMLPGQVCKHWRAIALSTPRLWSSSFIKLGCCSSGHMALTQSWLARSGSCPLSITLTASHFEPTFSHLDTQSDRWQFLNFSTTVPLLDSLRLVRDHLSSLETLLIVCVLPFGELLNTFEIAPRLRSLLVGRNVALSGLRIPWSQLTYCSLQSVSLTIDRCRELLQQSPNLNVCTLELHNPASSHDRPFIQHDHLHILYITATIDLEPLFDNLSLPALQAFSCDLHNTNVQQPRLLSFLSGSSSFLVLLILTAQFDEVLSEDDMITCLQSLSSLKELSLRFQHAHTALTKSLLFQLTRGALENGSVLPKLEAITLDVHTVSIGESLVDMIESRRRSDTSMPHDILLRSVTLHQSTQERFDPSITSRLNSCCRDGKLVINWLDTGKWLFFEEIAVTDSNATMLNVI